MTIIQFKRTLATNPPASLALGELALGLGDMPIKIWAGTPRGVEQFPAGISSKLAVAEVVEDAPDDGVYARSDGQWMQVPVVAPLAPTNPVPNMLWCDSSTMKLYVYLAGQWNKIHLSRLTR